MVTYTEQLENAFKMKSRELEKMESIFEDFKKGSYEKALKLLELYGKYDVDYFDKKMKESKETIEQNREYYQKQLERKYDAFERRKKLVDLLLKERRGKA